MNFPAAPDAACVPAIAPLGPTKPLLASSPGLAILGPATTAKTTIAIGYPAVVSPNINQH